MVRTIKSLSEDIEQLYAMLFRNMATCTSSNTKLNKINAYSNGKT